MDDPNVKFLFRLAEGLAQAEGRKEPMSGAEEWVGFGDESVSGRVSTFSLSCSSFSAMSTLDLETRLSSREGEVELDLCLLLLDLLLARPGGGEEEWTCGTSKGERESGGRSWRGTKDQGTSSPLGFT